MQFTTPIQSSFNPHSNIMIAATVTIDFTDEKIETWNDQVTCPKSQLEGDGKGTEG